MKEFREILGKLINYREKNANIKFNSHVVKNFITILCVETKRKYMVLNTTGRNIEIVGDLKKLYDDKIMIYDKYKQEEIDKTINLTEFYRQLLKSKVSLEEAFDDITSKLIFIKRHELLEEYVESINIGLKLVSTKKRFYIREISYFKGKPQLFTSNTKKIFNLDDSSVISININSNLNIDLLLFYKSNIPDLNISRLETHEKAKEYKDFLVKENKKTLAEKFNVKGDTVIVIKNFNLHIHGSDYEKLPYSIFRAIKLSILYRNQNVHQSCLAYIKNIPFDEVEKMFSELYYEKSL
ncbi:gp342 [Bacillus phage G]|uniref:Gp342 n=1 Tax=Bacillus phage G TaxID=2884420 RepID=G3MA83_9CAUD|nr:gp342 [Bacillus phage G]AEO93601.1 gp342 [Bacillus phage G]